MYLVLRVQLGEPTAMGYRKLYLLLSMKFSIHCLRVLWCFE